MMEIKIAPNSGFCFGVKRTIERIEELLRTSGQEIYSVGLPVHNPQLIERLTHRGLRVVDSVSEIPLGKTLLIRAHGVTPEIRRQAEERGLRVIDTTCIIVKKAQEVARQLVSEGYRVILFGEKNHPEVQSIYGFTDGKAILCETKEELVRLSLGRYRIAILPQTTLISKVFKEAVKVLLERSFYELRVVNTICHNVERQQQAARDLAAQVDLMMVVGGKMSSNTARLREMCVEMNQHSFHIETAKDIQPQWLEGVRTVGVAAGASTPDWLVEEVRSALLNPCPKAT